MFSVRLLSCALLGIYSLLLSDDAWSHAHLVGSEPPANAVIAQVPKQLRLRFSEPVEKSFTNIRIKADQRTLNLLDSQLQWDNSGKNLQIQMPDHAHALAYEIEWSLLAKDGHAGKGKWGFKVKPK